MTADGDLVMPIDAEAFGFWLKAAFGDPNATGTTDKNAYIQVGRLDAAQHGHRGRHA